MGAFILMLIGFLYLAAGVQEASMGHRRAGQLHFLGGILVLYYTLLLVA